MRDKGLIEPEAVTTATVTTILLKKGLRNVWMRGTKPIRGGQSRKVGRAFTLRFVSEMQLTEVAAACKVSLATVKRRLARAEKRFVEAARSNPALTERMARGGRWGES